VPIAERTTSKTRKLTNKYGDAVRELLELTNQQYQAIRRGDPESSRFDLLIHMATERKHRAKYALIQHVEKHGW